MNAPRKRPTYRYERALSVFGVVVAAMMAFAGLALVGVGVVVAILMSNYGSNK
ncbi:MAG TPA: hypothetical protein VGS97_16815 [Actinocrinis sp.]|uniref:hypothetical protein n=1 Tax=Actinocrinis sp. TaxID=1920516 RepID=UPI002DDD8AE8|nr:hypothetical protein [Actinocrinis sp.]HEV2345764.1 hypothetical protein [Actinocrinis sp.]